MQRRHFSRAIGASAALIALSEYGYAQTGTRYTRLILSSSPGGTADALFRIMEEPLRAALGHAIVIDYKPGGGGGTGHMEVSRGSRDGSVLGYAYSGPMSTIPIMRPDIGYDPLKDLVPVSMIMKAPLVLMTNPRIPGNDVGALLSYAKNQANGVSCGNAGAGGLGHLAAVLFANQSGMKTLHVPYKGTGPAVQALLGGEIDMVCTVTSDAITNLAKAGKIKIIGVASESSSPLVTGVPPISQYVPGFNAEVMHGIVAPRGTPTEVVERFNTAFFKVLSDKSIQARFLANSSIAMPTTPAQYAQAIAQEYELWAKVIKQTGIKAE